MRQVEKGSCSNPTLLSLAREKRTDGGPSGNDAPASPAGHGIGCRDEVSLRDIILTRKTRAWPSHELMKKSQNATPLVGTQLHCLPVGLARHCPLVDNLAASIAPELAERVGFEPTVELPRQRFSRPPDSATLAPLHLACATGRHRIDRDARRKHLCGRGFRDRPFTGSPSATLAPLHLKL